MPPLLRPYFAYGSNMCLDQMAFRCPGALTIGVARLCQFRFLINGRGYASIQPDPERTVFGLLWHISPTDEATLDEYEDYPRGLYGKLEVTLEMMNDGRVEAAMTYIAANRTPGKPRSPYLEGILRAADRHLFPDAYRLELASWKGT